MFLDHIQELRPRGASFAGVFSVELIYSEARAGPEDYRKGYLGVSYSCGVFVNQDRASSSVSKRVTE